MKDFFFRTLPAFMKSKPFIWGFFALVLVGMAVFFWASWTNRTPHRGPDQTDPWSHPSAGSSRR